jgi:hypothetical protein
VEAAFERDGTYYAGTKGRFTNLICAHVALKFLLVVESLPADAMLTDALRTMVALISASSGLVCFDIACLASEVNFVPRSCRSDTEAYAEPSASNRSGIQIGVADFGHPAVTSVEEATLY